MSIRDWVYDSVTAVIAGTLAIASPGSGAAYRIMREAYKRSYLAASNKGPHQLWRPSNRSGNKEVSLAASAVRAKIRDMSRNNPLVAGMKLKRTTMVIGDEIGVKAQVVGPDGKPNKVVNQALEEAFLLWAETASVDGRSLTEVMQLTENHRFDDGEVILREVLRKVPGANPLKLQLLEADYLDSSKDDYGIKYDEDGNPTAYNLYSTHPGGDTLSESTLIPAVDKAGLMVHLLADTDRASQRRGISQLAPAVMRLYGLDDLEDAELVASRAACAFGLVIKSQMPGGIAAPWTGGDSTADPPEDANGKQRGYLEAGGILELDPGEDAIPFKNERPNSNFDSFVRGRQRTACGAVGMSYESGTGDYSQVNYSSAKMGKNVEWAVVKRRQKSAMRTLTRVWRVWLRFEMLRKPVPGVRMDDQRALTPVWQLAGNDSIDALKELNAFEKSLMLKVNSRSRFIADHGGDFREIAQEIAEENATLDELGLLPKPEPMPGESEDDADDDQQPPPTQGGAPNAQQPE